MNLAEAMQRRRSIRKFRDQPVSELAIRTMLQAAICAPSASNRQPWRFMVVREAAIRAQLAAAVQRVLSVMGAEVQSGFEDDFQSYGRCFVQFANAPVLIVALVRSEPMLADLFQKYTPAYTRLQALETNGALISVAMAVQNLLLSATTQGLGACVQTGPLIAADGFDKVLSVPDGWNILCLVTVGYPDEDPAVVRKKSVDQILIQPFTGDTGEVQ